MTAVTEDRPETIAVPAGALRAELNEHAWSADGATVPALLRRMHACGEGDSDREGLHAAWMDFRAAVRRVRSLHAGDAGCWADHYTEDELDGPCPDHKRECMPSDDCLLARAADRAVSESLAAFGALMERAR